MSANERQEVLLAGLVELARDERARCALARAEARTALVSEALAQAPRLVCGALGQVVGRLALRRTDLRPAVLDLTRDRLAALLREELQDAAAALAAMLDRAVRHQVCAAIEHFLELAVTTDRVAAELGLAGDGHPDMVRPLVAHWHHHQRMRDLQAVPAEPGEGRLAATFELGLLGACLAEHGLHGMAAEVPWSDLALAGDVEAALHRWLQERAAAILSQREGQLRAAVADRVDARFDTVAALVAQQLHNLTRAHPSNAPADPRPQGEVTP